ncbi:hypothetical protein H8K35_06220 [Undibacterium sp. LX40W]|uniref:DUF2975 domain-containing protein n=1 Tax=Undibacterium nitidum TaxID=2762298 RepID=A0A923KS30_9BURK|nr:MULTISPECIES: hypothetical protein [Undibacterium]MBC3880019.1 hypothetical protein [Undibacterium nitidum]MBC3891245.1 hypothetical protein [Undibacterium sp. LX40W]
MSTKNNAAPALSMSAMTKILVIVFTLNLIVEKIAQLSQAIGLAGTTDARAMLMLSFRLPHFWTGILVPVSYLVALWSASNLLRAYERARGFDLAVFQEMKTVGANLMYAGIAALFLVPTLESWINLGGRSFSVNFDINPVAIGMIGVILKLIGRRSAETSEQTQ